MSASTVMLPMTDRRQRSSLAVRITALCVGVAGVVAVVAGLVSVRLADTVADQVSRATLADQADVLAGQLADVGIGSRLGLAKVAGVLKGEGIAVVTLTPFGPPVGADAQAVAVVRTAGITAPPRQAVSATVKVAGQSVLVEARPTANGGFALVQRVGVGASVTPLLRRDTLLSLGIGLIVAAVAGLLLARLLSKPLRRTAQVAMTMSNGRRDLRAPVEGPREVADVADAVNRLSEALARSESRQKDFLLSVSHELRTPLTAVSGFAESLADGVVTGTEVPRIGQLVLDEAHRLDRLVRDLLDLARLGAEDFRLHVADVDLTGLVLATAEVWHARCAARDVPYRVLAPPHPVVVLADPRRLRQVVDGLTENALRITPAGRPIVLSLDVVPGSAVLRIRDGGPGLADADYQVAFQRGVLHGRYQHDRPVGTGVGLALAHGLVTRMGGTIAAGRAPEGGACFTITLGLRPVGRA
ncbi:MAG TPA: HAMP domain-containing sensor histidine kinase [Pseudonocardiaceae bacterium]|nr:HAMP domain-containing sensor histidine kinase [Pseudonocardiaceae bacterium]